MVIEYTKLRYLSEQQTQILFETYELTQQNYAKLLPKISIADASVKGLTRDMNGPRLPTIGDLVIEENADSITMTTPYVIINQIKRAG